MLEASGALVCVNEPLNPSTRPAAPPGCCGPTLSTPSSTSARRTSGSGCRRSGTRCGCASTPWPRCAATTAPTTCSGPKYTAGFGLGRLRGRRALLDDPYAVFAAPGCSPGRLPGGGHGPRPGGHRVELAAARLDPAAGRAAGPAGPGPRPPGPVRPRAGGGRPPAATGSAGQPAVAGDLRDGGRLPPGSAAWRWSGTRTCRPTRCRPSGPLRPARPALRSRRRAGHPGRDLGRVGRGSDALVGVGREGVQDGRPPPGQPGQPPGVARAPHRRGGGPHPRPHRRCRRGLRLPSSGNGSR